MQTDTLLDHGLSDTTPYEAYPIASRGKRIANYFIDYIAFSILGGLLVVLLGFIYPAALESSFFAEDNRFTDFIFGAILILIYYPLTEGSLEGRSLGKLVTKTRAVRRDGNPVTMEDVLIRSISRVVPFDAFSFLGSEPVIGWHDKWAKTIVVDEKPKSGERTKWE